MIKKILFYKNTKKEQASLETIYQQVYITLNKNNNASFLTKVK